MGNSKVTIRGQKWDGLLCVFPCKFFGRSLYFVSLPNCIVGQFICHTNNLVQYYFIYSCLVSDLFIVLSICYLKSCLRTCVNFPCMPSRVYDWPVLHNIKVDIISSSKSIAQLGHYFSCLYDRIGIVPTSRTGWVWQID